MRYTARAWGTQLEVHVAVIPAAGICQLWVTSNTGQGIPAGGWAAAAGQQQAWYPASAPVPVSGLRGFEVTSAGKTLVVIRASRAAAPPRPGPLTPNLAPAPGSRR